MSAPQSNEQPDFSDLPYSSRGVRQLWRDIQPLLAEQGGLCGEEIADQLDAQTYGYEDASIRNGILPKMRQALREQGFISVDEVPGEDAKIIKKVWMPSDDT